MEELVIEVMGEILRDVAGNMLSVERQRVQEEQRRVEEERWGTALAVGQGGLGTPWTMQGQLEPAQVLVSLFKLHVFLPQWHKCLTLNSSWTVQAGFPFAFSGDLLVSILIASELWWKWCVRILGTSVYPELPERDMHLLYAGTFPSEWATCLLLIGIRRNKILEWFGLKRTIKII